MDTISTHHTVTRHTITNDQYDNLVAAAVNRDFLTGRAGWELTTEEQRVQCGIELYQAESRVPEAVMRAALAEAPLLHPERPLMSGMFEWLREQNITDCPPPERTLL